MIKGERVFLRDLSLQDLDILYEWSNDLENTRWLLIDPPVSREMERAWIESMSRRPDQKAFMICTTDGAPIGTLDLSMINWKHFSAQVGISIFEPSCRGKGLGTEAMRLVLGYAFHTLKLNRVQLYVFKENLYAIRSYEKCGFVTEGLVRECYYKQGKFVDAYLMSILRNDWK